MIENPMNQNPRHPQTPSSHRMRRSIRRQVLILSAVTIAATGLTLPAQAGPHTRAHVTVVRCPVPVVVTKPVVVPKTVVTHPVRAGYRWVAGHWDYRPKTDRWVWIEGHWVKR
ncbi:MAG: YXWGXW repeat-containing protein [Candidatus Eisenbacteria bacterium]|uniref:YXWGXW repeat-containing protein n=1 Tax=Eiseniibacteriota bacterium TaxID=2212470 RepID=A0A956LYR4_UNCEI|nr:YXWGXW repeat-containing protein [Candidatus Eisenbacteria bacterium]